LNIGSRSTSGNAGNVIMEFGMGEIMGYAVSMESLSIIDLLFSYWHLIMHEYFFKEKLRFPLSV